MVLAVISQLSAQRRYKARTAQSEAIIKLVKLQKTLKPSPLGNIFRFYWSANHFNKVLVVISFKCIDWFLPGHFAEQKKAVELWRRMSRFPMAVWIFDISSL